MATDSVTGPQPPNTTETLISTASPPPQTTTTSSSSTGKGKSKIEEEEDELTCGICLAEGGKDIISRGWIDSCDHYFCFVCIMEWSKLESKCPLCKRRFSSIRRPPKPGVFLYERVVNVPVRDQVYHYSGNSSVGPPNLYSDIKCSVCQSGADDCLLLLCDLCDSASHTYCVGLGATVPEVDWFCPDCALLRAEHAVNDTHAEADDQGGFHNFAKVSSTEQNVSIFSIVRDPCTSAVRRSSSSNFTTSFPAEEEIDMRVNTNQLRSRRQSSSLPKVSKLNTRTLRRCHNVHDRIQALRENWISFRSGSLSFASTKVDSGAGADQKPVIGGPSGQPDSASCLSQPLISQNGPTGMLCIAGSNDINKAWKMMDVAKSIEGRKRTKLLHPSSQPLKKKNASKESDNMSSTLLSSKSHRLGYQDLGYVGPQNHKQYHSHVKENRTSEGSMLGKQNKTTVALKDVPNNEQGPLVTFSSTTRDLTCSQEAHRSLQRDGSNGVGRIPLNINLNYKNKVSGSACLDSSAASVPVKSDTSCSKPEAHASSSSSEINPFEKRIVTGKNCIDRKSKGDNDAKSEIQSLVKLNLKILTRDKKLEVDAFKKLARTATHSILVACGLEHPKPGVRPFATSICRHANEIQELRRSLLMPSSCRECFYLFVKDVVNTIMVEKRGCTTTN